MNYLEFLKYVPKITKESLPAMEAHLKMIPESRKMLLDNTVSTYPDARKAAVLVLLYPKNNITHLALIVRANSSNVHSSQIAFPGGKVENFDLSYKETALRETHEEVGIRPEKVTIIKPLTEVYISISNFLVFPYLGYATVELEFIPAPDEVASIIELPLHTFLHDIDIKNVKMEALNEIIPVFEIHNHLVWGATAMMLSELKELLKKVI